jgi:hypothetical protein
MGKQYEIRNYEVKFSGYQYLAVNSISGGMRIGLFRKDLQSYQGEPLVVETWDEANKLLMDVEAFSNRDWTTNSYTHMINKTPKPKWRIYTKY